MIKGRERPSVTLALAEYRNCGVVVVFLSEATERRASALEGQTGPSQLPTALMALDGTAPYRRINQAFHCKLKGPAVVDKKTLVELQNFQTVSLFEAGWPSFPR